MNNFTYKRPKNLKEASRFSAGQTGDVMLTAGGTDLLGRIKDGIDQPREVVDLKALPGLDEIDDAPGKGLIIGALVKVADVAAHAVIAEKYSALALAAKAVGSPQLRNMGTIGGNLCQRPRCWYFRGDFHCLRKGGDTCFAVEGQNKFHCIVGGGPCFIVHPSDTAVALTALGASVTIFKGKRSRKVPLKDFFVLPDKDPTRETILTGGEIVTHIHVPPPPPHTRSRFIKAAERETWDFATVSVAAVLQGEGNNITGGTLALGGVAPIPWLVKNVTTPKQAAEKALKDAEPMTQNEYKIPLAKNLIEQVFAELGEKK